MSSTVDPAERRALTDDRFLEWYVATWPRLVSFAVVQTRSIEEGEDIAAETTLRALSRWDSGDITDPTAWSFTVAKNLCRRSVRRRIKDRMFVIWPADQAAWDQAEVRDPDLVKALTRLPRRQRLAVAFRYLADMTQQQVADAMGIAPGTAAALLSQGRARLRRELEGDVEA